MKRRPIAIDLFAGAGGLSLGFEQAGFDVVGAVEFDPIHAAAHEYNFPETRVFCADVTKLNGLELLKQLGIKPGEVDVVFGGPPCQGFSLIGKRLADDPRNSCIFHFRRLVGEIRPKYFVMENVAGMTVGSAGSLLEAFITECEHELHYRVVRPVRVLNAAEYGVPQDRRRLFVYGYRRDCSAPSYPTPTHRIRSKTGKPVASTLFDELPLCPSVDEAIRDLPDIDDFEELSYSDSVPHRLTGGSTYAKKLRGVTPDESDYSYRRIYNNKILTSSMRADHGEVSRQRFEATECGATEPISRFYKLPPRGICNTLRAGTASDRGAFTSPRPIHPYHPRCISVREAARLHSYPDWFRFHITKWHGFRQIGNSVPPLLGRAVAGSVLKALHRKPTRPRKSLSLDNDWKLIFDMKTAAEHFQVAADVIRPRLRKA